MTSLRQGFAFVVMYDATNDDNPLVGFDLREVGNLQFGVFGLDVENFVGAGLLGGNSATGSEGDSGCECCGC